MKNNIFIRLLSLLMVLSILTLSVACQKEKEEKKETPATSEISEYVLDEKTGEKLIVRGLSIDNSKAIQENFLGFNAISQGFMFMPDMYGRDYTDKQRQLEIDRIKKQEIKMLRTYYDQGFAAQFNADGKVIKNPDGSIKWDWDSEFMTGLYKWFEALDIIGVEVVLNLGWGAHVLHESTSFEQKNHFYCMNVEQVTEAYADWVCQSVNEIIVKRGYKNVKYGVVLTEPHVQTTIYGVKIKSLTDEDKAKPGGTLAQTDWYVQMIPVVDAKLKKAGIRDEIKLIGPNATMADDLTEHPQSSTITIRERVQWYVENLEDYLDIWGFHWYAPRYPGIGTTTLDMYADSTDMQNYYISEFTSVLKETGKEFWFDELNYSYVVTGSATHDIMQHNWGGTQLSELLIANMNAGLQNNLLWALNAVQWPLSNVTSCEFKKGLLMTGTYRYLNESSTPYKQYYTYSMLAKYLGGGEGTKIFEGTGKKGVYTTMVKQKDGSMTIMVVNTNISKQAFCIKFKEELSKDWVKLHRHLYDPETIVPDSNADIIGIDKIFSSVKNQLQDTLPPGGVAVYTTRAD